MTDPALFCAVVFARFLPFMDFHGNVADYAKDFDASPPSRAAPGPCCSASKATRGRPSGTPVPSTWGSCRSYGIED